MNAAGEEQTEADTAMQAVLEAESQAFKAVQAAQQRAADMLATAHARTRRIGATGEARIGRVRTSHEDALQVIRDRFNREGEVRLGRLTDIWKLDEAVIERAVHELAERLIRRR